jgi:hypothetical protein
LTDFKNIDNFGCVGADIAGFILDLINGGATSETYRGYSDAFARELRSSVAERAGAHIAGWTIGADSRVPETGAADLNSSSDDAYFSRQAGAGVFNACSCVRIRRYYAIASRFGAKIDVAFALL